MGVEAVAAVEAFESTGPAAAALRVHIGSEVCVGPADGWGIPPPPPMYFYPPPPSRPPLTRLRPVHKDAPIETLLHILLPVIDRILEEVGA